MEAVGVNDQPDVRHQSATTSTSSNAKVEQFVNSNDNQSQRPTQPVSVESNLSDSSAGSMHSANTRSTLRSGSRRAMRRFQNFRKQCRQLLEPTNKTIAAMWVQRIVFIFILVSSVSFVLESFPVYYERSLNDSRLVQPWWWIEAVCVFFFTIELFVRYISTPSLSSLFKDPFNLIDLVAVIPFWIDLAAPNEARTSVLRVVRLFRVFRVFKVSRYTSGLQIIGQTIQGTLDIFAMLVFLIILATVVFSSLIFFMERGEWNDAEQVWVDFRGRQSQFQSVPSAFYWTIVTITTVGYGDQVPITAEGKLISCIGMLCGLIVISLPTSIIGSHFTQLWEGHLAVRDELQMERDDRLALSMAMERFKDIHTQKDILRAVERRVRRVREINKQIVSLSRKLDMHSSKAMLSLQGLKFLTTFIFQVLESKDEWNQPAVRKELEKSYTLWRQRLRKSLNSPAGSQDGDSQASPLQAALRTSSVRNEGFFVGADPMLSSTRGSRSKLIRTGSLGSTS